MNPDHLPYLFAAYTVVWIGIVLYVMSLARRHRALERELDDLRHLLVRDETRRGTGIR
jgi:CcmD family protein